MKTRRLSPIPHDISLLGFGCMRFPKLEADNPDIDTTQATKLLQYAYDHGINYFDTAYPYHQGMSETFVGEFLSKVPRDSFYLADKMPPWLVETLDDIKRIFSEQLQKCQVEYFDFYLLHALDRDSFAKLEKLGAYEYFETLKAEGLIKHLGFSFHDNPKELRKIVAAHSWDFAQIQLNYLDWELQDAKRQYEILSQAGIPVIVMEPVRGGALATLCPSAQNTLKEAAPEASLASWAIRYAATLPNVLTVLSGMSTYEQVQDNIQTMTDFKPLDETEQAVLATALDAYKESRTIPCTGCQYCMPCPAGVDIPKLFSLYNQYCVSKDTQAFKQAYEAMPEEQKPYHCIQCKKCMEHCPQGISIPKMLQEAGIFVESLLETQ